MTPATTSTPASTANRSKGTGLYASTLSTTGRVSHSISRVNLKKVIAPRNSCERQKRIHNCCHICDCSTFVYLRHVIAVAVIVSLFFLVLAGGFLMVLRDRNIRVRDFRKLFSKKVWILLASTLLVLPCNYGVVGEHANY